jgi:hypothetical protein
MINFFRKLRGQMFSENKYSKYIIYAIGEIALVVIGILIALKIDGVVEVRHQKRELEEFKIRLLAELDHNIVETSAKISLTQGYANSAQSLLGLISGDADDRGPEILDSLLFDLMNSNTSVDISLGTIKEGYNTRIISFVESEALRTILYSLETYVQDIKDADTDLNKDVTDNLFPFLYDNFTWRRMDGKYAAKGIMFGKTRHEVDDYTILINDRKFENLVDNRLFQSLARIANYKRLKIHLEEIRSLVEKENLKEQ